MLVSHNIRPAIKKRAISEGCRGHGPAINGSLEIFKTVSIWPLIETGQIAMSTSQLFEGSEVFQTSSNDGFFDV